MILFPLTLTLSLQRRGKIIQILSRVRDSGIYFRGIIISRSKKR